MKQFEPTVKEIDGNIFYIRPFGAFKSANISGRIVSTLGPVATGLVPIISSIADDSNDNLFDKDITEALPSFCEALSGLSGDKLESLVKTLLTDHHNITVETPDDKKGQILDYDLADELFCGDVQNMYVLCFYVIKINYGGFFTLFKTQSGNVTGQLKGKKKSTGN